MKKIGLICLALVLALGAMGAGLAFWNETLTINGTVATGELDVEFSDQASNDDNEQLDPSECGTWTTTGWEGARYAYHVASTTCELINVDGDPAEGGSNNNGNEAIKITVTNAYPCYYGNVAFTIDNIGSIPVHIESIQLMSVSSDDTVIILGTPVDLVACTIYYVDADTGNVDTTLDASDDFSIHLSELAVCQEIAIGGAIPGDICVHVEEGAEESMTYDFSIEIVVTQFNAP